jgi:septal ring factor EnvC (AmiA/AmiB activator)
MTEQLAHLMQWMPLSAAFGFIIGETYSDLRRRRRCLQEATEELRKRLEEAGTSTDSIRRALKEQRGVINDIHKRLIAVSKSLEKRPS